MGLRTFGIHFKSRTIQVRPVGQPYILAGETWSIVLSALALGGLCHSCKQIVSK